MGTGGYMRTLCALAVVTTAAGVITGLPFSTALACDNDRFPCPIVSDAPETTDAPAKAAPGAPSRKKATNQAAPRQDERATLQDEKARPKSEREASRAHFPRQGRQAGEAGAGGRSAAAAPAAVTPAPAEVQRTGKPGARHDGFAGCAHDLQRWRPGRRRRQAATAPALGQRRSDRRSERGQRTSTLPPLRHPGRPSRPGSNICWRLWARRWRPHPRYGSCSSDTLRTCAPSFGRVHGSEPFALAGWVSRPGRLTSVLFCSLCCQSALIADAGIHAPPRCRTERGLELAQRRARAFLDLPAVRLCRDRQDDARQTHRRRSRRQGAVRGLHRQGGAA